MRKQFVATAAAVVLAVAAQAQVARSLELGRYTALAMRQYLQDEVSLAMADGEISRSERSRILGHAKKILKTEEYEAFRHSLNRTSPPKPAVVRHYPSSAAKTATANKQKYPLMSKLAASRPVRQPRESAERIEGPLLWRDQTAQAEIPRTASRGSWAKSASSDEVVVSDKVVPRGKVR